MPGFGESRYRYAEASNSSRYPSAVRAPFGIGMDQAVNPAQVHGSGFCVGAGSCRLSRGALG